MPENIQPANRNTLWASLVVDELARCGVTNVSIAPGSRSTPLALAFFEHPRIQVYTHLDERSAAFFALGIGLASGRPAAVVCTSGTAAANFYPAVVEANQSQVPLLVLTADRAPEAYESGANQTIDQARLYGAHVRWFANMPLPEANPSGHLLRAVRSLASRAYARTMSDTPGPVHLNFPFRKPLEPVPVASDLPETLTASQQAALNGRRGGEAFVQVHTGPHAAPEAAIAMLAGMMRTSRRGVIVCGPRAGDANFAHTVSELAHKTGYPILADPLSGIRFGQHVAGQVIGGYDSFLAGRGGDFLQAECILHFGAAPVSTALLNWLGQQTQAEYIQVSPASAGWADEHFITTHRLVADPAAVCTTLTAALEALQLEPESKWLASWQEWENRTWQAVQALAQQTAFEGLVLPAVLSALPANGQLFIANSLPVRHLDQFCPPQDKPVQVYANRGASGIDGITSTAAGVAAATQAPVVLVTGDLSFLHDTNGLLALQRHGLPVVVVVINNQGGGIFHRLPIAAYEPPFTDLFITPHTVELGELAQAYTLPYTLLPGSEMLPTALAAALASGQPHIIEVKTNARDQEMVRKALVQTIQTSPNS